MADQSRGSGNGEVPLLGPDQTTAMEAGLTKAGVLCALCGRTTAGEDGEGNPREYLRIDPKLDASGEGKPTVVIVRLVACRREDCDDSDLAASSHAWREYQGWNFSEAEPETDISEGGGAR